MVPINSEDIIIKTFLLLDLKEEIGDKKVEKLISGFFCALNPDVEYFLKNKAIVFGDTNKASTYLIILFEKGKEPFICAYFSLAYTNFEKRKKSYKKFTTK